MIDVTDKLRQAMKELKAEAEQAEDPAEKEKLRYQISCIASTLLQLENPDGPRAKGYEGVYPHWYKPTKKTRRTK